MVRLPISAKETRQQKERWGWRLETMGKGERGVGQNLKGGAGSTGGIHKIEGLETLCQLCYDNKKVI